MVYAVPDNQAFILTEPLQKTVLPPTARACQQFCKEYDVNVITDPATGKPKLIVTKIDTGEIVEVIEDR